MYKKINVDISTVQDVIKMALTIRKINKSSFIVSKRPAQSVSEIKIGQINLFRELYLLNCSPSTDHSVATFLQ